MDKKFNLLTLIIFLITLNSCSGNGANTQKNRDVGKESASVQNVDIISKATVFNAGEDGINSYRIPSLVTSKNGTLLLFCEARKINSYDKNPTDIVVKRSLNGTDWSTMKVIAKGGNNAYMDPCAIVDMVTGKIFLFTTLWPTDDHSGFSNTAWLTVSDDDGISWSEPVDITNKIVTPGNYIGGFGPGSGFQMDGEKFKDRLILPTREFSPDRKGVNKTVYSDDNGATWKLGQVTSEGGEFQIAESPHNVLVYNLRGSMVRKVATSRDGGDTWTSSHIDSTLKSIPGGIQGSILGIDNVLFYTGPAGPNPGEETDSTEPRSNFKIFRSINGGKTWINNYLLYNKAAGYSCITQMNNGNLAIVFETADTNGFMRINRKRAPGWMRLDVIILKNSF